MCAERFVCWEELGWLVGCEDVEGLFLVGGLRLGGRAGESVAIWSVVAVEFVAFQGVVAVECVGF